MGICRRLLGVDGGDGFGRDAGRSRSPVIGPGCSRPVPFQRARPPRDNNHNYNYNYRAAVRWRHPFRTCRLLGLPRARRLAHCFHSGACVRARRTGDVSGQCAQPLSGHLRHPRPDSHDPHDAELRWGTARAVWRDIRRHLRRRRDERVPRPGRVRMPNDPWAVDRLWTVRRDDRDVGADGYPRPGQLPAGHRRQGDPADRHCRFGTQRTGSAQSADAHTRSDAGLPGVEFPAHSQHPCPATVGVADTHRALSTPKGRLSSGTSHLAPAP
jgi:hypothetical protein